MKGQCAPNVACAAVPVDPEREEKGLLCTGSSTIYALTCYLPPLLTILKVSIVIYISDQIFFYIQ